jgi:hypothetical protein
MIRHKFLVTAGLVLMLALTLVGVALAATTSISSTINNTDTMMVNVALTCSVQATFPPNTYYYEAYPVTVDTTGSYTAARTSGISLGLWWYSGPFDTNGNALTNCLAGASSNSLSATLTAGQQYYLIVINASNTLGAYTLNISGPGNVTIGYDNCGNGHINCDHGDEYAQVLNRSDSAGKPDLQVWCVSAAGQGSLGGVITQADLKDIPATPSTNTLVKTINCRVPVTFWVLTTGEYQINIGPNAKGNTIAMVFTGFPPTGISFQRLDADR